MSDQDHDLHGNAPDQAPIALLLIDVINDLAFADGQALLTHALPMATKVTALKRRAKQAGIPSMALIGFQGRGLDEVVQPDFCHDLFLKSFFFGSVPVMRYRLKRPPATD